MDTSEFEIPKVQVGRSGGRALGLLSTPLNGLVLKALNKEPMGLGELRKATGGPAQSTLRGYVTNLVELGAVARRPRRGGALNAIENHLTSRGEELLTVARTIELWLERAPAGPIPLGSDAAKGAIKALTAGWESTMLCTFAARPFTLTQLNTAILGIDYPALERRLGALHATGLVEPIADGGGTAYTVTPWARLSVGPIAASVRFERLCLESETAPITPEDIQGVFLLAIPITPLPSGMTGACHLSAETEGDSRDAGVHVSVDRGKVLSLVARLDDDPLNWARGTPTAWLDSLVHRETDSLEIGGDKELVHNLIYGLHDHLIVDANPSGED